MRKIIHIDMDCFFAAVEERENPKLKGKPVAVGGLSKRRGVLCTCNYEARKFGVRSAMPSYLAIKKCPDLILVKPNFSLYQKASQQVHQIFLKYTHLIEPLSLDEAYLDVTDCPLFDNSATQIAREIRKEIKSITQLNASAGISYNKLLAKIACSKGKPNNQLTISPEEGFSFISQCKTKDIPGVGKVLHQKLTQMDLNYCYELHSFSQAELQQRFGKFGAQLYYYSRGIDEREVTNKRIRKSLSSERTFEENLTEEKLICDHLKKLFLNLLEQLEKKEIKNYKTLQIKIRYHDFSTVSSEIAVEELSEDLAIHLFQQKFQARPEPIRLLGVGVKLSHSHKNSTQLSFDSLNHIS